VLTALHTLLKQKPPDGHRLLVLGTTSLPAHSLRALQLAGHTGAFQLALEVRDRWVTTLRDRWVTLRARWVDAKSSLGGAKSSLGDVKSSLGDAESSLSDAKSSLGDAKSSLGRR
jgi:hypothetical protein